MLSDIRLLNNRQGIVDYPIQNQTGREKQEENGKDDREHLHHFSLDRIDRRRIQALLNLHRDAHDDRQDIKRILCG